MILWVDEDRVIRTSSHARFTTDTDRFVKIDDAISSLEHCCSGTSSHAGSMGALVAASDLMRAAHLWKHSHVDVLDVGASDAHRHDVLGLAGSRARMTTDAAGVVDYLGPLHLISAVTLLLNHATECRAI